MTLIHNEGSVVHPSAIVTAWCLDLTDYSDYRFIVKSFKNFGWWFQSLFNVRPFPFDDVLFAEGFEWLLIVILTFNSWSSRENSSNCVYDFPTTPAFPQSNESRVRGSTFSEYKGTVTIRTRWRTAPDQKQWIFIESTSCARGQAGGIGASPPFRPSRSVRILAQTTGVGHCCPNRPDLIAPCLLLRLSTRAPISVTVRSLIASPSYSSLLNFFKIFHGFTKFLLLPLNFTNCPL